MEEVGSGVAGVLHSSSEGQGQQPGDATPSQLVAPVGGMEFCWMSVAQAVGPLFLALPFQYSLQTLEVR